jgi:hypothetical protein
MEGGIFSSLQSANDSLPGYSLRPKERAEQIPPFFIRIVFAFLCVLSCLSFASFASTPLR